MAGAAVVQSGGGAQATKLPTPASVASSSDTLDGAMGQRQVLDSIGRLEDQRRRAVAVRAPVLLYISIVAIKPEDEEVRTTTKLLLYTVWIIIAFIDGNIVFAHSI